VMPAANGLSSHAPDVTDRKIIDNLVDAPAIEVEYERDKPVDLRSTPIMCAAQLSTLLARMETMESKQTRMEAALEEKDSKIAALETTLKDSHEAYQTEISALKTSIQGEREARMRLQEAQGIRLKKQPFPNLPLDSYLQSPFFHRININYPGLQMVRERPFIFVVHDFLTKEECAALVSKAEPGLCRTQLFDQRGTGKRTSSGVVCDSSEIPSFRKKMVELANVPYEQLQDLKISKYLEGEEFSVHTDGICPGPDDCSKEDLFGDAVQKVKGNLYMRAKQNRFMTVFVYLNDCERGGCTAFPRIGMHSGLNGASFYDKPGPCNTAVDREGRPFDMKRVQREQCDPVLRIAPRRGLAVIHFPTLTPEYNGTVDGNVTHQSEPAIDNKYICQQFIYSCSDFNCHSSTVSNGRLSDTQC